MKKWPHHFVSWEQQATLLLKTRTKGYNNLDFALQSDWFQVIFSHNLIYSPIVPLDIITLLKLMKIEWEYNLIR